MNGAAILRRPGRIGRRPNQRMAEPDLGADAQQLLGSGRTRRIGAKPQRLRRPPQQRGVPGRIGRRQQHELPSGRGQHSDPAHVVLVEPVLEMAGRAYLRRVGETARKLGLAHPAGQLEQPERVSAGLGDDPVAYPLVEMPGHCGREQGRRVLAGQPFEGQRRQPGQ